MKKLETLLGACLHPFPLRQLLLKLIRTFDLPYDVAVRLGAVERPHYAYSVFHAADLAKRLGYSSISVCEFGVAGGNGLVCLEECARSSAEFFKIRIDVYGFDSSTGLPATEDYRDIPYAWKPGMFKMDVNKLKARLNKAELILGNVEETVPTFITRNPAPIGALLFDLDYYSSTIAALNILRLEDRFLLPRVFCYFDDILGSVLHSYSNKTGVRLAIEDFNRAFTSTGKNLDPAYFLHTLRVQEPWHKQIYIAHSFWHTDYCKFIAIEQIVDGQSFSLK